jgi:NADH:ubiquinone reductase (H+-translocating)
MSNISTVITPATALCQPVHVTVLDRRNYHLFQPLLYQVATVGLSPGDIAVPIRSLLRRQCNTTVLLAEVEVIDLQQRHVLLTDGVQISYDYLILATGARQWLEISPP